MRDKKKEINVTMKFPTARDPFMKKSNNKFILKNYCITITSNSYKYEIKKRR